MYKANISALKDAVLNYLTQSDKTEAEIKAACKISGRQWTRIRLELLAGGRMGTVYGTPVSYTLLTTHD